ncbi:MAG TPA: GNAT family N-acetyltransferase [Gaiellaceae bacterium]|nr:GNAT family N-acetyltransferase [Gaiellaceae bacterium]
MTPTLGQLAEDTMAYLLPSPSFTPHQRDGYVYVAGPRAGWVVAIRRVDIEAVRAEAVGRTEWWLGPSAPPDAEAQLVAAGFVRDEVPTLTGMTCATPPPDVPGVEVRTATPAEVAATEQAVWGSEPSPPPAPNDVEHHFAALIGGELVGTARAVDTATAVALMGGVVLPEARRRGVYRALVRARWEHAVARGTPTLVVQAGEMSAPVLDGLGFTRHCELRLWVDVR